jgi:hypothetical protein
MGELKKELGDTPIIPAGDSSPAPLFAPVILSKAKNLGGSSAKPMLDNQSHK